jgi:hypothetical protein
MQESNYQTFNEYYRIARKDSILTKPREKVVKSDLFKVDFWLSSETKLFYRKGVHFILNINNRQLLVFAGYLSVVLLIRSPKNIAKYNISRLSLPYAKFLKDIGHKMMQI